MSYARGSKQRTSIPFNSPCNNRYTNESQALLVTYYFVIMLFFQAPASSEEKAEWRLLTSKTASGYLKDLLKDEEAGSREPIHQDDRVPECDAHKYSSKVSDMAIPEHSTLLELKEKGREQCVPDESSSIEYSSVDRKNDSLREKGLSSMFVTSLSAIGGGSHKKQSHRKRKVH